HRPPAWRCRVSCCAGACARSEWMSTRYISNRPWKRNGKQDAIGAKTQERGEKRRQTKEPRSRDRHVVEDRLTDRPAEARDPLSHEIIATIQHHRQSLAHVSDDDL